MSMTLPTFLCIVMRIINIIIIIGMYYSMCPAIDKPLMYDYAFLTNLPCVTITIIS